MELHYKRIRIERLIESKYDFVSSTSTCIDKVHHVSVYKHSNKTNAKIKHDEVMNTI